jgi:hypothetical protein
MEPRRKQLQVMYRIGRVAGITVAAFSLGIFLGGDHRPEVIGFGLCAALFAAGQWWALNRST